MPMDQPPAFYQLAPGDQDVSLKLNGPTYMTIAGENGELVSINLSDGSIKFGADYKPNVAAQQFWSAVSSEYKSFLDWKKANANRSDYDRPFTGTSFLPC